MMMLKARTAVMSAAVLVSLAGLNPVRADVPAVVDRIPANAGFVVAVRNIEQVANRMNDLIGALHLPMDEDEDNPLTMSKKMLALDGLNKSGSLAFAMLPGDDGKLNLEADDEHQRMVMIIPVSNYESFAKSLGATDPKGISSVTFDDKPAYLKDIGGGYAAMGPAKEGVESFAGKKGNLEAHTKALGKAGGKIADSSDVFLAVNIPMFKEQIEQGVEGMKEKADGMAGMMGEQGAQVAAMMGLAQKVGHALANDGQIAIVGMGLGEQGVSLDFGAQFKEGSDAYKMLSSRGNPSEFLARVPNQPFLFAMAADFTAPGIKAALREVGEAQKDSAMSMGMGGMMKQIDKVNGMAFVMGANKGGIMGLFANTVSFVSTADPAAYLHNAAEAMNSMNGKDVQGMKFKVDYKPGAVEVAGVKADSWTMSMDLGEDNPNAGMMGMMQGMLFGPGGMGGMSAAVDSGVISTMSQNTPLFTSAIEAAKSGKGLAENEAIKEAHKHLPGNRIAEMHIGTKSILDAVNGFMQMQGGGAELKVPAKVSPVSMAAGIDSGGLDFRIYVPRDVMVTLADVAKAMKGGEDEDGEKMDAPAPDEKGGAPRF